jgi:hypothetical protein
VGVTACASTAEREPDGAPGEDAARWARSPGSPRRTWWWLSSCRREPRLRPAREPSALQVTQDERVAGAHPVVLLGGQKPHLVVRALESPSRPHEASGRCARSCRTPRVASYCAPRYSVGPDVESSLRSAWANTTTGALGPVGRG